MSHANKGDDVIKRILIASLLFAAAAAANAQDKPNVVIMLGDNVGYGDVGAYGAAPKSLEQHPNPKAVNMTQFSR